MTDSGTGKSGEGRLHYWMFGGFLAGLVLGLAAYSLAGGAPWIDVVTTNIAGPIGQIFLRLLFMLVIALLPALILLFKPFKSDDDDEEEEFDPEERASDILLSAP